MNVIVKCDSTCVLIYFLTVELTASLEPGNPDLPKTVKKIPKSVMLPVGNLRALSLLLLEDSATVQTGVRMYYESISSDSGVRQKVSCKTIMINQYKEQKKNVIKRY